MSTESPMKIDPKQSSPPLEMAEETVRDALKLAVEKPENCVSSLVALFKAINDYAFTWLKEDRKFQFRREVSDLFSAASTLISHEVNSNADPTAILSRLVTELEQSQRNRGHYGINGLDSLPKSRLHVTATGGEQGCRTLYVTIAAGLICSKYIPTVVQGNYSVTGCGCGMFAESDMMEHLQYPIGSSEIDLRSLSESSFAYLHVQRYHPILKVFCSERGSLGFRDMMKLAVVLADPYCCDRQFVGVWDQRFMAPMARVLKARPGVTAGAVVASATLDEFTQKAYVFKSPGNVTELIAEDDKGGWLVAESARATSKNPFASENEKDDECRGLVGMFGQTVEESTPRLRLVLHNAALALATAFAENSAPKWQDVLGWRTKLTSEWSEVSSHAKQVIGRWPRLRTNQ